MAGARPPPQFCKAWRPRGSAALVTGGHSCAAWRHGQEPRPCRAFGFGKLAMVSILLLFGAVGEELMFRGYAFQLLAGAFGLWRSHSLRHPVRPDAPGHLDIGSPAAGQAAQFGVNWVKLGSAGSASSTPAVGCAVVRRHVRSGRCAADRTALRLEHRPALAGARLSGFTIVLTGYELKWSSSVWLSGGEYGRRRVSDHHRLCPAPELAVAQPPRAPTFPAARCPRGACP